MTRYLLILLVILCSVQHLRAQSTGTPVSHTDTMATDTYTKSDGSWMWGIFYFNKSDTRLFPPKGNGMGWTINWANPLSIGAFIVLIFSIFLAYNYFGKGRKKKLG